MKNGKWAIAAIAIVGVVVYLICAQQSKEDNSSDKKVAPAKNQQEAVEKADMEALTVSSADTYSSPEHPPTPVEKAVDLRVIPPETAELLLEQYKDYPTSFENNEAAALLLATLLLETGKLDEYRSLASRWEEHSAWPSAWFVLDGDLLTAQNKKEEAVAHFRSKAFKGHEDTARLGRLALLTAEEEPDQALMTLKEAEEKYPGNPILTILAARVLEKENKITEAAQELSKGIKQTGNGTVLQTEALADLFRRYGYEPFALSTWNNNRKPRTPEAVTQILFWERVLLTEHGQEKREEATDNDLYLRYLAAIPEGTFWDEEAFNKLPNSEFLLKTHQETYWLRLLDLLAKGDEQKALNLLQASPFKQASWNPGLEDALKVALIFRQEGKTTAPIKALAYSPLTVEYGTAAWRKPEEHPFVSDILVASREKSPLGEGTKELLSSPDAISAIFLAEGWNKAALTLHRPDAEKDKQPEWFVEALIKAIAKEKGIADALAYAYKQERSPKLDLQVAELYIQNGQSEQAISLLEPLRVENNETGARAAWITALHYWKNGKHGVARQIIMANSYLAETPMGQEALASLSAKHSQEPGHQ